MTEKTKISKNPKKKNPLIITLKVLLIISTLVTVVCFDVLMGAGWIVTYTQYDTEYRNLGILMIASAAVMTAATVLCLLKLNISAVIAEVIGAAGAVFSLAKMMGYADELGWNYSATLQPASDIFRNRVLPTIVPFVLLLIVAILQHFSYDAKVKRKMKREEKERLENMPAPKILGD